MKKYWLLYACRTDSEGRSIVVRRLYEDLKELDNDIHKYLGSMNELSVEVYWKEIIER